MTMPRLMTDSTQKKTDFDIISYTSEEIDNTIQFVRKHPETLGYAAGMTSGAALTWFANKFLEGRSI